LVMEIGHSLELSATEELFIVKEEFEKSQR
jgi:hypothetical protein